MLSEFGNAEINVPSIDRVLHNDTEVNREVRER